MLQSHADDNRSVDIQPIVGESIGGRSTGERAKRGWVKAEWGTSETSRRAKFYSLTIRGR